MALDLENQEPLRPSRLFPIAAILLALAAAAGTLWTALAVSTMQSGERILMGSSPPSR